MPRIGFTAGLAAEYTDLYVSCEIRSSRFAEVDRVADLVVANEGRYRKAAHPLGIPWFLVGAIHNLESSRRFDRHLHNGDPLTGRTRHAPIGRPTEGEPPFTWEESASDAMRGKGLHDVAEWTLPRILYEIERYNGWGYRLFHPEVRSPYVWGFSRHYDSGKYVADGRWSDSAVSRQCGAGVLIRRLEERGDIPPQAGTFGRGSFFTYGKDVEPRVDDLQRFLNTFDGIRLRVDGVAGKKTSDAVNRVLGSRLPEDPRD